MFKKAKRVLAAALAAGALMTSVAVAAESPSTGTMAAKDSTGVVKTVYTSKYGNHILTSVKKTSKKTITIPKTVVVKGTKVKINKIGANAFKNAKKVTKINFASTVVEFKKNAFKGCKKLKTITYSGKKSIKVKKGAFSGLNTKNITFKVNKKMSSSEYKKLTKALKKAGFKGKIKKVTFK